MTNESAALPSASDAATPFDLPVSEAQGSSKMDNIMARYSTEKKENVQDKLGTATFDRYKIETKRIE